MAAENGALHQAPSNTLAHGMGSHEEAKFRYWDADPEYLVNPFDVARQAAEARQREKERSIRNDRALGYVAVPSMFVE